MTTLREFRTKFRLDDLTIIELEHWVISLRPEQPTLGSLILSAKDYRAEMSALLSDETEELSHAFMMIARALDIAFKPDRLNYMALMMVDQHVHFHVLPRYETPRALPNGREFEDARWPKPSDLAPLSVGEAELADLLGLLRSAFHSTSTSH